MTTGTPRGRLRHNCEAVGFVTMWVVSSAKDAFCQSLSLVSVFGSSSAHFTSATLTPRPGAILGERFLDATAVINPEFLNDPRGARIYNRNFPEGLAFLDLRIAPVSC